MDKGQFCLFVVVEVVISFASHTGREFKIVF